MSQPIISDDEEEGYDVCVVAGYLHVDDGRRGDSGLEIVGVYETEKEAHQAACEAQVKAYLEEENGMDHKELLAVMNNPSIKTYEQQWDAIKELQAVAFGKPQESMQASGKYYTIEWHSVKTTTPWCLNNLRIRTRAEIQRQQKEREEE